MEVRKAALVIALGTAALFGPPELQAGLTGPRSPEPLPRGDPPGDPQDPPPARHPPKEGESRRILLKVERLFEDPSDRAFAETVRVSDIGMIAFVVKTKDGKHRVSVQGREQKPYNFIVSPSDVAAIQAAYNKMKSNPTVAPPDYSDLIKFASDQKTVYYPAYTGKGYVIASQDWESPEYDAMLPKMPLVSPDGKKVSYVAKKKGRWRVVVNAKDGPDFDDFTIETMAFSPDSNRLAYCAKKGSAWKIFTDKAEFPAHEGVAVGTPLFSPDSKRIAYVAFSRRNKQIVMVDGQEFGEFDSVAKDSLKFSADSKEIAFAAETGKIWYVYVNGKPFGPYEKVLEGSPRYEKDGKRLVWAAQIQGAWSVYEGGKPVTLQVPQKSGRDRTIPLRAQEILKNTPRFSPDGRQLMFGFQAEGKWKIFLEGRLSKEYDEIRHDSVTFTFDSSKLAFVGRRGAELYPTLNLEEGKACAEVGPVRISQGTATGTVGFCVRRTRTPEEISEETKKDPENKEITDTYWMVVINGEDRFGPYPNMRPFSLMIANNGKRIAFPAFEKGVWGIFSDGERRSEHLPLWIRFDPATNLLDMIAMTPDGWVVMVHEVYE